MLMLFALITIWAQVLKRGVLGRASTSVAEPAANPEEEARAELGRACGTRTGVDLEGTDIVVPTVRPAPHQQHP